MLLRYIVYMEWGVGLCVVHRKRDGEENVKKKEGLRFYIFYFYSFTVLQFYSFVFLGTGESPFSLFRCCIAFSFNVNHFPSRPMGAMIRFLVVC